MCESFDDIQTIVIQIVTASDYDLSCRSRWKSTNNLNCEAVINGDKIAIMKAQRYFRPRKPENFLKLKCSDLFFSQYPESEFERLFPLSYSILAYKNIQQLTRLIKMIYRPWNLYCIHVDLKAKDNFYQLMKQFTNCKPNIFIAKNSVDVQWGESSVLSAAHSCFNDLLKSKIPWVYVLNIAASDFPLKTNAEIVTQLKSIQPTSNLEILDSSNFTWRYQYRFENGVSWATLASIMRSNLTKPQLKVSIPYNVTVFKGSFSAALHRDFVEIVLKDKEFFRWFNDTYIPDEMYWPTLYRWAYPDVRIPQFSVRYTHWGDLNPVCQGYYEHGLCVFGTGDLQLLAEKPHMFAHKFDINIEPATLDCMEELIFNRTWQKGAHFIVAP